MPNVNVNDITLAYETHGSGEPLVLISGIGYDRWEWHKMVAGLAQHFTVIVFDNRGVGHSDKPAGPYSAQMLADDTAGLIAALGYERAHVMGHSMGGYIAQALALSHPELIDKLILASTNFGGPHHIPVTPEAMAVLTDVQSDPVTRFKNGLAISTAPGYADKNPDMIETWLAWRVQNPIDPAAYQAQLAIGLALFAENACFEGKLQHVTASTLILFGAHDRVVPPGNADLLAREIPHSTIELLPDAGHFFPIETPDDANAAILKFLKGDS
ncbi:MAG: alpha/beta fold hydrolase [Chloroflexi bacterium]|nr:alpha/beta fold hydrolase [Chloroflexota bacterium]